MLNIGEAYLFLHPFQGGCWGETVNAVINGAIIIGNFMFASTKNIAAAAWDLARKVRAWHEVPEAALKQIV